MSDGTHWITDRPPTHTDTGPYDQIWVWSPASSCALSYAYCAMPAGRPWAPGHKPCPTAAPTNG